MKEKERLLITFALTIIMAIILFFLSGCQWQPKRADYKNELEFTLADCLYRASANPIVCDKIAERYRDWHKEQSFKDKLSFCQEKKNIPPGWTEETCRYYLNQK